MKTSLNGSPDEKWEPVQIGGESFEVLVKRPTFEQKMADLGMRVYSAVDESGKVAEHRLLSSIVDWRGVQYEDVDEEIPFNESNLKALCSRYPQAADRIFLYAHHAFNGTDLTEDEEKN